MSSYLEGANTYVLAHRGGAEGLLPENSLAAFERATKLGCKYLETDVRLAEDGKLHLMHDATSLLPNQLLKLNGHDSPTLDQLFDRFPTSFFAIDPKHARAIEPLAELIVAKDMMRQVCIGSSFDIRAKKVANLVERASGYRPTTALVGGLATIKLLLNALGLPIKQHKIGATFIHVHHYLIRPSVVKAAHRLDLKLIAWVANDQPTMKKLFAWGVDGFMTDYPEAASEIVRDYSV